jgi:acyl-CoA thioester hydrolase
LLHFPAVSEYYETTVRVRYAETDQLGVVYHSNYLVWFEVGRVELLRQMGYAYKQMEAEDDCYIVVAEVKCRYQRPARYDDVLRVRTRLTDEGHRLLRFAYEIVNDATGQLLATGETTHVICDRNGRPRSLPVKYRKLFAPSHADKTTRSRP